MGAALQRRYGGGVLGTARAFIYIIILLQSGLPPPEDTVYLYAVGCYSDRPASRTAPPCAARLSVSHVAARRGLRLTPRGRARAMDVHRIVSHAVPQDARCAPPISIVSGTRLARASAGVISARVAKIITRLSGTSSTGAASPGRRVIARVCTHLVVNSYFTWRRARAWRSRARPCSARACPCHQRRGSHRRAAHISAEQCTGNQGRGAARLIRSSCPFISSRRDAPSFVHPERRVSSRAASCGLFLHAST